MKELVKILPLFRCTLKSGGVEDLRSLDVLGIRDPIIQKTQTEFQEGVKLEFWKSVTIKAAMKFHFLG